MPRLAGAVGQAARTALQIDRSKIAVDVGLRAALGVGLTLVVGRATGHTVAGVTATIGALSAGMASHQGTYRSRAAVVMAAAGAMGFCAFVGATIGHLLGPDIAVTALIGFLGALMVCLGPPGTVVGIQAVVGLVVFSQFAFPVAVAARDGGLVLLGGAVQALLIVAVWPLRRFPAERRAIGDAYGRLADFCRASTAGGVSLLDAGALEPLGPVTRDAQPFGGDEAAAHRVLADQADRIRLELVALARAGERMAGQGATAEAAAVDRVLVAAAHVLDGISHAVRSGTGVSAAGEGPGRVEEAVEAMRGSAGGPGAVRTVVADPVRRAEALAGQLRTAARAAAVAAGAERPPSWPGVASRGRAGGRYGWEWLRERAATVRSNLTLSSHAFRHALRMAVTLAVAVAVSHAFAFAHRYWLPMTAMLILRPDFGSTVTRGLARVLGTLIGAGVVTVILAEARPGPDWLIALVVLLCFPATALVLANYAVFSVCIASLVVTLLAFTGNPELATAGDRSVYTALGALLALGAYALWPTWEATSLPETLAELARTEARYGSAVLAAWADPASADRAGLQRARLDARLARSNAEASVTRWMAEPQLSATDPRRAPLGREAVLGYTAAIRAYVAAVLTLHAELPAEGPVHPGVARLAGDIEDALLAVADTVKGAPPGAAPPPLRSEQLALAEAMGVGAGRPSTGSGPDGRPRHRPQPAALVLAGETDLMVNSINTLCHLVGLEPV